MANLRKSVSTPLGGNTNPSMASRKSTLGLQHHKSGGDLPRKSIHRHDSIFHRKSLRALTNPVKHPSVHAHMHAHNHPTLEKEKKAGDLSGDWGKIVFCKRHFHSLTPMRILFHLVGRFPFSIQCEVDGKYTYVFTWYYPGTIYFVITLLLMLVVFALGMFNVAHVTLNSTVLVTERDPIAYESQREMEHVLIRRYFIPLIFIYSSMVHGCVSAILFLYKHNYIANYLTFWSKAVHTLHMDVSRKALGFSMKVIFMFIVGVILTTQLAIFRFGPTAIGLPTIFGGLTLRLLIDDDTWLLTPTSTRTRVQIAGAALLVYAFVSSKVSILFFIHHCKTLQSSFAYWNGRVYASVLRGGEFAQTEEGRTTYKLLFKDYCVLMDLMEGLDQVYAWTVESYLGCQVFSLFYEIYFVIRTAKTGDNRNLAAYPDTNDEQEAYFIRPKDWAPGLVMLIGSVALILSSSKSAADVAEEAMAGLEVLRRKTMLGRKTDDELYFMMSMFSSYTAHKKLEVCAAGYFYMNKDFLMGLVSSVLSYFIILYQFQPVMDISLAGVGETRDDRIRIAEFLTELEGLDPEHYETTPSSRNPWEDMIHENLQRQPGQ